MCFGGSKTTPTPQPEPSSRFDYNVAQPGRTQQQKVAAMSSATLEPNQQAGQTLGGTPATPTTY
jgi:hypothetical protein